MKEQKKEGKNGGKIKRNRQGKKTSKQAYKKDKI